jgi:kynurenine formamidase
MKTNEFLSCLLAMALCFAGTGAVGGESEPVSIETVNKLMKELSNWGKWGKDDEMGAMNYITPETRKAAAKLVREGVSVSIAHDVEMEEAPDVGSPFIQKFNSTGETGDRWATDQFSVNFHGYAHTHMDSLCHMFAHGMMYNGYAKENVTAEGAKKLAVTNFKNGIFARGILMDIPRLKGVPYLPARDAIYPADLEAWEKKAGFKVGKGDVVIFHTGRWAQRAEKGPWDVGNGAAGLHISCMKWLHEREVAMVGSDAGMDILPSPVKELSHPIHQLSLIAMGMPILDNLDSEALSAEAQRQGRWEFLLTAAPLAVPGGTGSPLNPIATF